MVILCANAPVTTPSDRSNHVYKRFPMIKIYFKPLI